MNIPEVSAEEAFAAAAAGEATIVDVREPDEWAAGRIEGAVHIPLGLIDHRRQELGSASRVLAVCRSGKRSGSAVRALRAAGIDARNVKGGLQAWVKAGLPLEPPGGRVA